MGALFVGLILLCLNSVVMVINKTFASPQSLNDEQFSVVTQYLGEVEGFKHLFSDRRGVLSFANFLEYMIDDDPSFRTLLVSSMRNFSDSTGHLAFFWECKPVSRIALSATSFEYVLIPSTELEGVSGSSSDFEDFENCGSDRVISFYNIGKDAVLIAPCPGIFAQFPDQRTHKIDELAAGHLGAFIKHAPMELIHVFLKTVGNAMLERFKTIEDDGFHAISKDHKKLWLSTSGLGVKWVHVRIDSSPKYYNWEPYSNTLFGR